MTAGGGRRAMVGAGLSMAVLGPFAAAVRLLVWHTAAAPSICRGSSSVVGHMGLVAEVAALLPVALRVFRGHDA